MFKGTLATILLCLSSTFVSSAHAVDRDGRWWSQMNQGEKLSYIAGFFDGTDYSAMVLTGTSLNAMADPKTGKFNATRAEAVKAASLGAIRTIQERLNNVTAGQLVEGLDTTYGDYRNQGISVSDCISVVIYGIKGASEADITRMLEAKRKQAGK